MKRFLAALLAAMLLSSVAVLSGCKNDGNDKSSTESITESKSTNDNAANQAKISSMSKEIEALKEQPTFSATKSIDAKKISKNKRIAIIADSSNNTYSSYIAIEVKKAAESAGFDESIIYDTDGTSNSHSSALENAVSDQCSAALLIGNINKDEISLPIETAQANGMKIISLDNAALDTKEHFVDSAITTDYVKEARILADYAIVQKDGKVNALLVIPSNLPYAEAMKTAVTDELKNYSSGYCTELSAETSTWESTLADSAKKILEKDTNINCVIVLHEGMMKSVVNALEMSQSISRVALVSRGGGTEAFSQVQNGNAAIVAAESYEWTAYSALNYILEILSGNDSPEPANIPFMIISYDNVKNMEAKDEAYSKAEENEESTPERDYGDDPDAPFIERVFKKDFKKQYRNLWGIKEDSESSQSE